MTRRTLGVEEELHLVSRETSQLAARAPQVLSRLSDESFSAELQRSTVETNTAVCDTLDQLRREVLRLRADAEAAAAEHGLGVAACGTTPLASPEDFALTASGRFGRMQQDYRLLVDEHLICGLQVHVGLSDRDFAVRVMQRIGPALPTLLALSASSPFWRNEDTGYASVRSMIWQRWPSAGRVPEVATAAEYDRLVSALIRSGVISDARMAYFDVRPSSHAPTLELRVCDSTPLVDDVILIAGLFRAVVEQAAEAEAAGERPVPRPAPLYQAAMWRAARSGLVGDLLGEAAEPGPKGANVVVRDLLERLRPQLEDSADWEEMVELCAAALGRASSPERQRARYAEQGRMADVVQLLVEETIGRSRPARREEADWTAGYREHPEDEAVGSGGSVVAAYRPVFAVLDRLGAPEVSARAATAVRRGVEEHLTFGVDGEQRAFPLDVVPRVIPPHEWSELAAGLTQRARALEAFLRDAYGAADVVRDGILPAAALFGCTGWRDEARLLPAGVTRAPVIGFDLIRDAIAGWRVLEDNVRVPSGVGYAIAVRRVMTDVLPELTGAVDLHDVENAAGLVAATLRACAPGVEHPVVALLSDGADNSGWYEHRLLAEEAGFLLAQPGDVDVVHGAVTVGGCPVDVCYLRLGGELVDLVDVAGRPVGAQILAAAQGGRVVVANAPGNGIADDKAMYCTVPDLIAYYLHERPVLASVPTYRCADPGERELVLDRLGELVTKPVGGSGGGGVLIGSEATAAELEGRRAEITADPAHWVAQETVALSTLPVVVDDHLEPRHVDLRTFVYLSGTGVGEAQLADVALTRMAPAGSMVVNSSRGGGAKDTWILGGTA